MTFYSEKKGLNKNKSLGGIRKMAKCLDKVFRPTKKEIGNSYLVEDNVAL